MHEHLERATAHSGHATTWSCNHRICNHRFLRPDSKNKFSSFWFYCSLLDKQCWEWKLCAQEATKKSWRVVNYRAGCMLERKESSSFMERYAKERCRWAFIPLILCYSKYSGTTWGQNGKMMKGQASLSECFTILHSFCICHCFWHLFLRLNLDSPLPFFNSHIWPTPERCPLEVSSNERLLFEGTLLNELSYSLQTSCINSSLMENEIFRCKVKEVQNVMITRDWEVCS